VSRSRADRPRTDQLDAVEAEAVHIIREAPVESHRPALLFHDGKDSAVLPHLALRAFVPARLPHTGTGHKDDGTPAETVSEVATRPGGGGP
jgi:sulfate adenylyltransferase subunit 2